MADAETFQITRLGAQGDGIAESNDGPVFVPYTLPGETVAARRSGNRAILEELIIASPERIVPLCTHYGVCGGCVIQHLAEAPYMSWKRELVAKAFAFEKIDVGEITIKSVEGLRRRAVLSALVSNRAEVGFHELGTHTLVDIRDCPVHTPRIVSALPHLREMSSILAGTVRGTFEARIAVLDTSAGLDIAVECPPTALPAMTLSALSSLAIRGKFARITVNSEIITSVVTPVVKCGSAEVVPPPGSFAQAVEEAQFFMTEAVVSATGKSVKNAVDLFCGFGAFSLPLAKIAQVFAFDNEKASISALADAVKRTTGIKKIEARSRDLHREPLSPRELQAFDFAVFDPPRTGAEGQARALAASQIPTVVAVSCNPSTLARDARYLINGGYRIEKITVIDQFKYTPHVETVAVFRRQPVVRSRRKSI